MTARIAAAPTAAAAWALAVRGGKSVDPLPIAALRLEEITTGQLRALGINTIGLLLRLPREQLVSRFGPGILHRIDQLNGDIPEPLVWLTPHVPIAAEMEFESAIESLEAIHLALRELIGQVAGQLERRGLGAREMRLKFSPPYATAVEKIVRLTRPCRNTAMLFNLLSCAVETLEIDEGVLAMGLSVSSTQRLGDAQPAMIGGEEERSARQVDHLIERLRARLDRAVEWAALVESYLPERAFLCSEQSTAATAAALESPRPLRLLNAPEEIRVMVRPSQSREGLPVSFSDLELTHRLSEVRGPERIGGQWWNGRWKTRDYFDVQDEAGKRYWIFRVVETRRWYLHGIFG